MIVERNLIYLVPLVFVGTALVARAAAPAVDPARGGYRLRRLLARVDANYALENVPYSDALGLAIAQMSNRNLSFTDNAVQWALIVDARRSRCCLLVAAQTARRAPDSAFGSWSA